MPRTVSVPAVVIGVAATALLGLVTAKLQRSTVRASIAIILFLSSPVVFHTLWTGSSSSVEVVSSLGWLLTTLIALERPQWWPAAAAGAIAGAGLYTHGGGMLRMPLLAALSAVVLALPGTRTALRNAASAVGAFTMVAAPMAVGYLLNPDRFNQLITSHGLYDASRFNLLQGIREIVSWVGLVARSEAYHDYFNPSVWFLSGSSISAHLTEPRVLLLPLALFVPVGLYRLVSQPTPAAYLILGALVIAPVPTALLARPPAPAQLLFAVPLVVIAALVGADYLVSRQNRWVRFAAYAAFLALLPALALIRSW